MCRQMIFLVAAAAVLFNFCSAEYATPYKFCNSKYVEAECHVAKGSEESCLAESRCRWGHEHDDDDEHDGHDHGDKTCLASAAEDQEFEKYLSVTFMSTDAQAAITACRDLAETACTGDCAMFDDFCLPTVAKLNSLGYDDEPGSNLAVRFHRCAVAETESACTDASMCHWEDDGCAPILLEDFLTEQCPAAMAILSPASSMELSIFAMFTLVFGTLALF